MSCPDQSMLDAIFPPERTNAFFDALYGGAEEGAYDIQLVCLNVTDKIANMAFELKRRPGKCLKCSLTYGLPAVFQRHPVINIQEIAKEVAKLVGFGDNFTYQLGTTQERSDEKHLIPFVIAKS